jgi:hypothetical protein
MWLQRRRKTLLQHASTKFKEALSGGGGSGGSLQDSFDSMAYCEACGLFKYFLSQAIDLGKQVWTRFDTTGMTIALIFGSPPTLLGSIRIRIREIPFLLNIFQTKSSLAMMDCFLLKSTKIVEKLAMIIVIIFHCVTLTFSNSYIITEESIIMFMLSVLCIITSLYHYVWSVHIHSNHSSSISSSNKNDALNSWNHLTPLLIAVCSRMHELLVTEHGQDSMIVKHLAHQPYVFLTSLVVLSLVRIYYHFTQAFHFHLSKMHSTIDVSIMCFLAYSWIEKRSPD